MGRLTLNTLISGAERRLEIFYMGSRQGMGREVNEPVVHRLQPHIPPPAESLLIIDPVMVDFVTQGPESRTRAFYHDLKIKNVRFAALSDSCSPPEEWRVFFERHDIPWCVSRHDPHLLESRLLGLIRERIGGTTTVHAGLIEIDGWGILLTGEAGSGKTRIALELLEQGYGWIADDIVILNKKSSGVLTGRAHIGIKGLLHLQDRGIHPVSVYNKDSGVREEAKINMIYELPSRTGEEAALNTSLGKKNIMGISIPVVRGRLTRSAAESTREIIGIVRERQRGEACP